MYYRRAATPREVIEQFERIAMYRSLDRDEERALFEARIQIGTLNEAGANLHAAWADLRHAFVEAFLATPWYKFALLGASAGLAAGLIEMVRS